MISLLIFLLCVGGAWWLYNSVKKSHGISQSSIHPRWVALGIVLLLTSATGGIVGVLAVLVIGGLGWALTEYVYRKVPQDTLRRLAPRVAIATLALLALPPFGLAFPVVLMFAPVIGLPLLLPPLIGLFARKRLALSPKLLIFVLVLNATISGLVVIADIKQLSTGKIAPEIRM